MLWSSFQAVMGHINQPLLDMDVLGFAGIFVLLSGLVILGVRGLVVMKRSHGWTVLSIFMGFITYGTCSSIIEDNNPEYFFVCIILGVSATGFGIMAFLNFRKEKKVKRLQK